MARVNFGRSASTRGYNPLENMVKPGYILKKGAHYFMVDSIEGMNYQVLVTANGNTAGTEVGNGFDSGFFEDKDLEPFRNHMYFLIPSLSRQPKFISRDGSYNGTGFPDDTTELTLSAALKTVGAASRDKVGDISGRVFLQHPAGIPRWSADELQETTRLAGLMFTTAHKTIQTLLSAFGFLKEKRTFQTSDTPM